MNIKGLVTRIRNEFLSDSLEPYHWATSDIVASLSHAERELCRRLFLISDSTTEDICEIDIVAGTATYSLDDRVLKIDRLKYPDITQPLTQTDFYFLDEHDEGWEDYSGTPTHFVVDMDSHTITLNRMPLSTGTIKMKVKRLPLLTLIEKNYQTGSPELKQLDDEMIHGALKYLYIRPDVETFNVDLAKKWDNQFETDIGIILQNRAAINPRVRCCTPERF